MTKILHCDVCVCVLLFFFFFAKSQEFLFLLLSPFFGTAGSLMFCRVGSNCRYYYCLLFSFKLMRGFVSKCIM